MLSFESGSTALIISRQEDSPEFVKAVLASRGIRVLCASTAEAALRLITALKVHLLIDNITGVATDSCALLRAVRALPENREQEVVHPG